MVNSFTDLNFNDHDYVYHNLFLVLFISHREMISGLSNLKDKDSWLSAFDVQ